MRLHGGVLLHDVVTALGAARATTSRKQKAAALADCLSATPAGEVGVVATWLSGRLPQRRTGVGYAALSRLPEPAGGPTLEVAEVDAIFSALEEVSGPGSAGRRGDLVADLFGRATAEEQRLLRGLISGDVRAGVKEGTLLEAVAASFDTPAAEVRRAVMLAGSAAEVASLLAAGADLTEVGLVVGRPAQPMLASPGSDLDAALERTGLPCFVDAKLDGIRVQAHKDGDRVGVWSRSLDDLTGRFPGLEEDVLALPGDRVILDGEALLVGPDDRPRPFQETAGVSMTRTAGEEVMRAFWFDVLHLDGRDLLDEPLEERHRVLSGLVPDRSLVQRQRIDDPEAARAMQDAVLDAGHEGVVVKTLDGTWQAGRRGAGWLKVKPVHTLDLVVLGVEWGSGRRTGSLSNLHLGARDGDGLVMLGKTFKGMTDEMLAWQTERFLGLETHREGHTVFVEPVQVVEIAFDGVQRSTRYPGGVALRFARVLRYRDDKSAAQADTIETVRGHLT